MPAVLNLTWNNSAVAASANAIGQRASKRIASVGGAWDTSGFKPLNDLPVSATHTAAGVIPNIVYDFKIEALCNIGGPTINANGVRQGIYFAEIIPQFSQDDNGSDVDLTITLSVTSDITKARIKMYRQIDDNLLSTQTPVNSSNTCSHTFAALANSLGLYFTVELYTVVNGIEIISSAPGTLSMPAFGGNIPDYQITTLP